MVNSHPKVGIIMPTYNRADLIGETIESIRRQTYHNWELVIVDDGSDDNTEAIISEINDERICFLKAGRLGVNGKIKNLGIKRTGGELIAFIDSDDLWADTKLEKQVIALQQYPGAGFSLTGGFNFRKRGRPVDFSYKQREGIRYDDIFISIFRSEISATTPSLIFRRECLSVIGAFDETKPFSDIDFILKLASHFKAVILYEPLLYRRLHDANDSEANWVKGYHRGIEMIRRYKNKLPSSVTHDALFRLYINFGEDYLARRKTKNAVRNFFCAWANKPLSIVPLRKTAKAILNWPLNNPGRETVNIPSKPWKKNRPPRKILAIRLQALGDVVITLPYLQYLRHSLPETTRLDFLTRKEYEDIPKNIFLFSKIISLGGGRDFYKQLMHTILILPKLLWQRYDVVIDLQNNSLSELMRKVIHPSGWSVFDRFSSNPAGERTRLTIEAVGLGKNEMNSDFRLKNDPDPVGILKKNGWNGRSELVVLNPAAAFETRNWPLEHYVSFAGLWLHNLPNSQFLVLGTSLIAGKAARLKEEFGDKIVAVIDSTTPSEAFAILQRAKFVLSEDSGLMHMAWVGGIPVLALFGSTRSDWARPLGKHSVFLDSADLPCGNCMQEICAYGDNHCLTRYTPEFVFNKALGLINRVEYKLGY